MAAGSVVHGFEIALSDVDRGVYESLSLKTARHPSETDEYLVARVLAYALEFEEGITFSQGLSAADEPAVWVHDLTGRLVAWIEVGTPSPERLHRASKAADRVVVYCHKDPDAWLRSVAAAKVYAPEKITVVVLPRALVTWLSGRIGRRTQLTLSLSEGELYVDCDGESTTAALVRQPLGA